MIFLSHLNCNIFPNISLLSFYMFWANYHHKMHTTNTRGGLTVVSDAMLSPYHLWSRLILTTLRGRHYYVPIYRQENWGSERWRTYPKSCTWSVIYLHQCLILEFQLLSVTSWLHQYGVYTHCAHIYKSSFHPFLTNDTLFPSVRLHIWLSQGQIDRHRIDTWSWWGQGRRTVLPSVNKLHPAQIQCLMSNTVVRSEALYLQEITNMISESHWYADLYRSLLGLCSFIMTISML
jgi:hypothetical protein